MLIFQPTCRKPHQLRHMESALGAETNKHQRHHLNIKPTLKGELIMLRSSERYSGSMDATRLRGEA
jgi:hypothetical protein